MTTSNEPTYAVFMSYARHSDEADGGWLTEFRERLSSEVSNLIGEEFTIFQDKTDIRWGEQWKKRVADVLDATTLLFAVLSPHFFKSDECLNEVERFLEREKRLARPNLILPVWYIELPRSGVWKESDRATKFREVLAARQCKDKLCELRCEPFTAKPVRDTVNRMAQEIVGRLGGIGQATQAVTRKVGETAESRRPPEAVDPKRASSEPGKPGFAFLRENEQEHKEYRCEKDGAVMVEVPAGKFWMGSGPDDGRDDERPLHEVFVSRFLIDKYPVTNQQFEEYTQASGYKTQAERLGQEKTWRSYYSFETERHPVVMVTWNDAQGYCKWAGKRLPTEAEWEKAARGQGGRQYPWGSDDPDKSKANVDREHRGRTPVGSFPAGASPFGVMDMAGNVWEWCSDLYAGDYYKQSPAEDPKGPSSGSYRVLRGGCWCYLSGNLRSACRSGFVPSCRSGGFGFRCAVDA